MVSSLITSLLMFSLFRMIHSYSVFLNPQAALTLRSSNDNFVLRVPTSEAVPDHVKHAEQGRAPPSEGTASDVARQRVPHELNIRYGNGERQLLDIYGTDLPPGSPIFVYLHGGLWSRTTLNKENSAYPVIPLWREGIKVVVGEYDLAPNVTLDVMVEEIKELVMFVLEMAKKENSRNVWFAGHSSGAHLTATSLLQGEWYNSLNPEMKGRIQGVVLISGIYNLIPYTALELNEVLKLDRRTAVALSPALCLEKLQVVHPVTVLLVVAQQDSPLYHDQTLEYLQVIRKEPGIKTIFLEVPGFAIDHFSNVINLQYSDYLLTATILNLIERSEC